MVTKYGGLYYRRKEGGEVKIPAPKEKLESAELKRGEGENANRLAEPGERKKNFEIPWVITPSQGEGGGRPSQCLP